MSNMTIQLLLLSLLVRIIAQIVANVLDISVCAKAIGLQKIAASMLVRTSVASTKVEAFARKNIVAAKM